MDTQAILIELKRLKDRQWHLDTIGSYGAADSLQDEICRLRLLGAKIQEQQHH